MQSVRFTPQFDDGNGWYNILPAPPPARELEGHMEVDWLVVGAGYAGLAATRRLAENFPDKQIALIEADRVGRNTAGRNAGFAIDLPFLQEARGDLERGRRIWALHKAGQDMLAELVQNHQIACQWSRRGKYMLAVGTRAKSKLHATQEFLRALGADSTELARDALHERLGTRWFDLGLYSPGTCLMNPAALTRGLAASMPENVALFENSPILALDLRGTKGARTAKGSVRAAGIILATNGFTEAFGLCQQRMFSVMSYASLTPAGYAEPLGGAEDWGVHPVGGAGPTIRRTQDNRIWHRVGFAYNRRLQSDPTLLRRYRDWHVDDFRKRFPELDPPRFEQTHAGALCFSRNSEPVFQRFDADVFVVACQNAIGVCKGTIHGALIADWAAGKHSKLLDYARAYGEPCRVPREPFLGWGVSARLKYEAFRGRME